MKERSLLIFSLVSQMVVGAFWVSGIVRRWDVQTASAAQAEPLLDWSPIVCALMMGVALVASLFHLGAPGRAWRSVSNLGRSWLSREVLLAVMYAGLCFADVGVRELDLGSAAFRKGLEWLTGGVGLIFLFAMANVYRLRTVPAWNRWTTMASFFVTSFLMGGLLVGWVLSIQNRTPGSLIPSALLRIGIVSAGLLLVELIVAWKDLRRPAGEGRALLVSPVNRTAALRGLRRRRLVLIALSLPVTGAVALLAHLGGWAQVTCVIAFCLVLSSEAQGRVLFYLSRAAAP